MIKRRFYKEEHGDKNAPSSDSSVSSSSSDSELEAEAEADHDAVSPPKEAQQSSGYFIKCGYESEDSSANEIDVDSSDDETASDRQISADPQLSGKHGTDLLKESDNMAEKELIAHVPDCMLKCKSVYKCRICPQIVCLNEESMRAHLNSKRHARSEKLLKENRLKTMLNSDGEIENQETATEMNARIVAFAKDQPAKKNKGRQRQRKRMKRMRKKEEKDHPGMDKGRQSTKNPSKRIRKT
ncbi:hypothetical protein K2173_001374 [Erythroxylum novogranatense]|uniref:C2H2-type domain-containing protein n=1 Tax=Erythroxylum novogranatense TaxID=1862640 RepID=A0AAV8T534_9ROSI|nr:hypothetical protein K2173_001374 [Erythroxylum novogranatense]